MQLFILLCVVAGAFAAEKCGPNSHYNSCGTACPLTCENYQNPPKACVLMCNPGCHCDDGYVKRQDGSCVLPENCATAVCGENKEYLECGTACPLTCDNYANPPKICPAMCKIGCQCKKGYVQTKDNRCVLPESCPSKVGGVNIYDARINVCDLPLVTGPCNALFHRYGFDKTTGECKKFVYGGCRGNKNNFFSLQACNRACKAPGVCSGENQEFLKCGTACPLTCDNYANPPKICPEMCKIGCQCKKGYVLTSDNQCILPENCPSKVEEVKSCLAEADGGMCRGYFPMYHYDVKSGSCKEFIYGGCGGNGNRYSSEEECLNQCKV